jgi:hypothetical protein
MPRRKADDEDRVMVGTRIRVSSRDRIDRLAEQEGCDRATMLRTLLAEAVAAREGKRRQVTSLPKTGKR